MSKIFDLINDLNFCYSVKAPYAEDYLKMNQQQRHEICNDVRKSLIEYVNSPQYNFSDIVTNLHKFASTDEIYSLNYAVGDKNTNLKVPEL